MSFYHSNPHHQLRTYLMSKLRYYYYDQDACTFIEVKPSRSKLVIQLGLMVVVALICIFAVAWVWSSQYGTPNEVALQEENQALQTQLVLTKRQIATLSERLDGLAETDAELYRTLLQEVPISDEVRQVGVGGSELYEELRKFSPDTRTLLQSTSEMLGKLERQMDLQRVSYRDLLTKAEARSESLKEMPSIKPTDGRLVSGFGIRMHPIDRVRKMHYGLDFVVPTGSKICATGDGIVSYAGYRGGYGTVVEIRHPKSGYVTRYAHLKEPLVKKGATVKRGDVVALSGSTGRSTAPHLHYEVRDAKGTALNPIDFFAPSMTPQEYQRLLKEAAEAVSPLD